MEQILLIVTTWFVFGIGLAVIVYEARNKRRLQEMVREQKTHLKNEAIAEIVELLRKKDKIFLQPVAMSGGGHTIADCVFFGNGRDPAITITESDVLMQGNHCRR